MPSTITFIKNTTREFLSAYRPIDIWAFLADSDVAYLRAELYMEKDYGQNNFVSTGVLLNGYEQNADAGGFPGVYAFNAMEYVRHYVGKAICPIYSYSTFQLPGQFETGRFYLKIWAVRYTADQGVSFDDYDTSVDSNIFIATPANLSNDISTSAMNENIWLDRYVLGQNGLAPFPGSTLPLTKMPKMNSHVKQNGFMIDMQDFPCDSLYTYWSKGTDNLLLHLVIIRYNDGTNVSGVDIVQLSDSYSRKERIPVHPISLSAYISFATGNTYNSIIDVSGNLICKKIDICLISGNSITGLFPTSWWSTRSYGGNQLSSYRTISYSNDLSNCGLGKQRSKFIFQNSLGGIDWFSCYGKIEESVSVADVRYDKHQYAMMREHHTTTRLITSRVDTVKVFSQPLDKDRAMFLAELYASPKVWIQQKMQHSEDNGVFAEQRLTPINIVPGSWDLYSTENNLYFLEFEYNYSEQKTQPKG